MALTTDQKSSRLFKKSLGAGETLTTRDFFEEPKLGNNNILPSQIWAQADQLTTTAPVLTDGQITGVTQYFVKLTLAHVAGSNNAAYYHSGLTDTIPFNYGDGSYNYALYKNDGTTQIAFGQGDWLVDTSAGLLTFYGSIPAGVTAAAPPKITFYKYVGVKGLIASGVTTDVSSLSTALSAEISGRTYGDQSLSTSLSMESSGRTINEQSLSTLISTETIDRTSADQSLSIAISTSISGGTSSDQSLSTALSTQVSTLISVDSTKLSLSGGTMTGSIDMSGNQIIVNVPPASDYDLANKQYVDAIAQGIAVHAPVHVVATTGITLSGSPQTIDGHQVNNGDFVLVTAQGTSVSDPNSKFNGIYVVSGGTWSRRADADGQPTNEIELGDFVYVQSGVSYHNTGWAIGDTNAPSAQTYITTGDTQMWFLMTSPGSYTADGEGIILASGTTFKLDLNGNTLYKDAFGLKVSDSLSTAIANNTTSLSTTVSSMTSGDNSLSTSISGEVVRATSAEGSLSIAISGETSRAIGVELSLSSSISVISGDTVDLSSILSNGEVLGMVGGNLTGVTYSQIVSGETSRAMSAESSLSTAISGLSGSTSGLTSSVLSLSTAISVISGVTNSLVSDAASLSTAVSGLTGSDSSLSIALSSEIVTRGSADSSLSTSITGVTSSVTSLSSSISTQVSILTSTDVILSSAISEALSETVSLSIVVSGLTSTDTSLSIALSGVTSSVSSLSTAITVLSSTDSSLSLSITGLTSGTSSLSTAVSTEISDRTSADTSLTTRISIEEYVRGSADSSLSTAISTTNSTVTSADLSLSMAIVNKSGVTSQSAGSGLTFNSGNSSLNVNVDNWTIKIVGNTLVGAQQWVQVSTTTTVSGVTSGYTGLQLAYKPVTPVSAYVNGVEYLVYPGTNPATNYPFFYNAYPPSQNTQIWFDPTIAGFDLISGTDVVTIKFFTVDQL